MSMEELTLYIQHVLKKISIRLRGLVISRWIPMNDLSQNRIKILELKMVGLDLMFTHRQ